MNLLVRTVLGLRQWASPGAAFALAIIGALFAVEVLGRQHATSDFHDLLAISTLALIGFAVLARHRRSPMDWLSRLVRPVERLLGAVASSTFEIGVDMRGTPPVKRGVPPIVLWTAIILAVAAIASVIGTTAVPHDVRRWLMSVSYLIYLALISVLWMALLAAIALAAFIPLAMIHDHCVAAYHGTGRRSRRRECIMISAYFSGLFLLGSYVDLWVAPVLSLMLFTFYVVGVVPPGRFAAQILWRPRNSIQVRSLAWGQWVACEFALIGLAVLALTFASVGGAIWGSTAGEIFMPLTTILGKMLAWLGPGFMTILCVQMIVGRLRDPARQAPPLLQVTDHDSGVNRRQFRRQLRSRGWRVTFQPAPPHTADATIELVSQAPQESLSQDWPLVLTPDQLDREGLFVRLARRSEIQRRRRFFTGLEGLLKIVSQKSRGGCGYWLSPHFWFVTGLMRDSRGDDDFDFAEDTVLTMAVGPPYHRTFPRPVRRHLFEVLRAVQIDLIFIEDGVRFKRLRRVLRALFEVYDVHAGRKPAEEIDFRGLPGTRVLIHDYQFDNPFQATGYPEPNYELLARARILHIFRDRGGEEEFVEPPFDFGRTPAPVGFLGQ